MKPARAKRRSLESARDAGDITDWAADALVGDRLVYFTGLALPPTLGGAAMKLYQRGLALMFQRRVKASAGLGGEGAFQYELVRVSERAARAFGPARDDGRNFPMLRPTQIVAPERRRAA